MYSKAISISKARCHASCLTVIPHLGGKDTAVRIWRTNSVANNHHWCGIYKWVKPQPDPWTEDIGLVTAHTLVYDSWSALTVANIPSNILSTGVWSGLTNLCHTPWWVFSHLLYVIYRQAVSFVFPPECGITSITGWSIAKLQVESGHAGSSCQSLIMLDSWRLKETLSRELNQRKDVLNLFRSISE